MKKTTLQRVLALALSLCLLLGMGILPKAEAVTPQWRGIATAETYIVADANEPSNVTLSNTAKAYYNKKIDVVPGTKISFAVNFSAYQSDAGMQYTFSLVDREGVVYQNGAGNALSAELSSAVGANVRAVTSRKIAGGSNRDFCTNIVNSANSNVVDNSRNTSGVYAITFEKLAETEANSWKISVNNGTGEFTTLISTEKIAHDLFQNGVYLAVGNMTTATGHVVNISDLMVVQPDMVSGWKMVRNQGLDGIVGELVPEKTNAFDATFNEFVTGYYNQKIKVQEGTTVSFRVQFPKMTDGINVQYGFSLVDRAGSFYTSDKNANSLSLEVASIYDAENGVTGALNAVASKKLAGSDSRTFLANAFTLAAARSTTDVYDVTFKKINETINNVNYSWMVTVMKNGATPYAYRYKASDVPHDFFKDGAYLAVGSMDGGATHTMQVSDLQVNNSWSSVAPAGVVIPGRDLVPEGEYSFNASFRNKAAGTYDRAIQVQEGTKISMKAKLVATTAGQAMWFGVSLADRANAFYNVDMTANALVVELGNNTATTTNMPTVASKKTPGRARDFVANIVNGTSNILAGSRATNMIYTITFEKLAETEANSWKVTVNNGTKDFTAMIGTNKVAHDMLGDEVYIAAGFMSAANGHNIDLFDLSVTQPDAGATVGGVEYDSLQDALDNAFAGETVELKEDLALTEALDLTDKAVTLELDGKTLSGAENLTLGAGTDLTVKGGSLEGKLALAADGAKLTADCPIALELNGKTATVNAKNVTLTDSGTDDGTEGGKVYGNITPANTVTKEGNISYVALPGEDDNGKYYTANAVRVAVKKVNIRPSAAGMYFTTEFKFNKNVVDAIASANNAAAEGEKNNGYGVVLSLEAKPGVDFMDGAKGEAWTVGAAPTAGDNFISTGNSCLVKDIFKDTTPEENAQRGATDIYANAYVKIGDTVIMAENPTDVVYSMKTVMQILNTMVRDELTAGVLSENSLKARAFYETWQSAMSGWNLDAMAKENDKGADA